MLTWDGGTPTPTPHFWRATTKGKVRIELMLLINLVLLSLGGSSCSRIGYIPSFLTCSIKGKRNCKNHWSPSDGAPCPSPASSTKLWIVMQQRAYTEQWRLTPEAMLIEFIVHWWAHLFILVPRDFGRVAKLYCVKTWVPCTHLSYIWNFHMHSELECRTKR